MEGLKELGISNNLKDLNKIDLKKIQNESNKLIKQNSKFVANEYFNGEISGRNSILTKFLVFYDFKNVKKLQSEI